MIRRTLALSILAAVLAAWWLSTIAIAVCERYDGLHARTPAGQTWCAEWSAPVGRRVHADGRLYR